MDCVEHARLFLFTGSKGIEGARESVGITGAFLKPTNTFVKGSERRTPAVAGNQRLDHGSNFLHFGEHRGGNTRRLHGDNKCDGSNTCGEGVDNRALRGAIVIQMEIGCFKSVNGTAFRIRNRHRNQHETGF